MSNYLPHVNAFCGTIRLLVRDMESRIPNDPIIYRVRQRVALACDTLPCTVVEMVGYYLYQYRDHLLAGNDQFFIENDYDRDVQTALAQNASAKARGRVDLMRMVMPKVKLAWLQLGEAERAQYRKMCVDMFDSYLDYMDTCPTAGSACSALD